MLSPLFAVLIALTTALAVPIVGAVIALAVTVIPGAEAARVTASPLLPRCSRWSSPSSRYSAARVLSRAPGLPISGYVTTTAFLCYLGCRLIGRMRDRVRVG